MFRVLRELNWFIKKEWWKYLVVLVSTIGSTYIITLPPRYIGSLIDQIVKNTLTREYVIHVFVVMLIVALAIYVVAVIHHYMLGYLFHKLFYYIKIRFLDNVFRQDGEFFENFYSGDLIARATGDTGQISRASTHLLFNLVTTVSMIILNAFLMFRLAPNLAGYAIIPLPLIFLIVLYIRPKISENWKMVRKENSRLNNLVMESVSNAKLIRGFVKEDSDQEKLTESATNAYKIERKAIILRSVFGPTFRVITLVSQGIALGYGAHLIINQQLSIGELITFNLYLGMFSWPLFRLGNQITVFMQSGIAFDRINEILYAKPIVDDIPNAIALENVKSIVFDDVSFRFPNDKDYTIKDIHLSIQKGQTIGIVGKTGSGKTTLIRQLMRQFVITKGKVLVNDRNIEQYQKKTIRANIAYVPQEHTMFSRTVIENIKIGEGPYTQMSLDEVIKMADFQKDLAFLTDGLDTIVGEAGVTLSGGQKQRLSIARALLKNAEVLILDDSLSAVDGMTEANILKHLKEFRSEQTNIIVAHRLTAVERADLIVVMDNGRITERGTHKELMAQKNWYYQQYIIQQMEDA